MLRREELKILIASLVHNLAKEYARFDSLIIESYIENYDKIAQIQLQINNYVKELKELNK